MDSRSGTRRPSASLVVSFIALAVAISGTAVALPGKNKVETNDIQKNAVTAKKIKKSAVTTKKVKNLAVTAAKLADGAVTETKLAGGAVTNAKIGADAVDGSKVAPGALSGEDIADNSIGDSKLSDYEVIGGSYILVSATDGANAAAAQAAAPETPLFEKGQLSIYAKCFRDTAANTVFAEIYSRTTADGSIQEGQDDFPGGNTAAEFLNTGTLEENRELDIETAAANDANYDESEYALASPDGTGLTGQLVVGAKNGNLGGGNGLYGSGNVCLFQGSVLG